MRTISTSIAILFGASTVIQNIAAALDPSCAPGGNFDLSKWELQLPIPDDNGQPLVIPASQLEGCQGYHDPGYEYFFTESTDGALVMKAPGNPAETGCTKYSESQHCRTEFGETNPSSWDTNASSNTLSMTLLATAGDNICIGQVFQASPNPLKPVCELYYYSNGSLILGVETVATGGNQHLTNVGYAARGSAFTYELSYEESQLGIAINGGTRQNIDTYFSTPNAFFKAGNYNQDMTNDVADIHVFNLTIVHGS